MSIEPLGTPFTSICKMLSWWRCVWKCLLQHVGNFVRSQSVKSSKDITQLDQTRFPVCECNWHPNGVVYKVWQPQHWVIYTKMFNPFKWSLSTFKLLLCSVKTLSCFERETYICNFYKSGTIDTTLVQSFQIIHISCQYFHHDAWWPGDGLNIRITFHHYKYSHHKDKPYSRKDGLDIETGSW